MSLRHELGGLRPRATLRGRVRRVRERAVRIVTAAGGAAAAWWLARDVLGHPEPFFAPVTVLVALAIQWTALARWALGLPPGWKGRAYPGTKAAA